MSNNSVDISPVVHVIGFCISPGLITSSLTMMPIEGSMSPNSAWTVYLLLALLFSRAFITVFTLLSLSASLWFIAVYLVLCCICYPLVLRW